MEWDLYDKKEIKKWGSPAYITGVHAVRNLSAVLKQFLQSIKQIYYKGDKFFIISNNFIYHYYFFYRITIVITKI